MADIPLDTNQIIASGGILGGLIAIILGLIVFLILIAVIVYIYNSLTLMIVAKKTKTQPAWIAWIPLANYYLMAKTARMHWWPLIFLIGGLIFPKISYAPGIMQIISILCVISFCVFTIIWTWKICEIRGKPGWWALITIIPLFGWVWWFILWGILAWEE
jgi:hypothetical protein